MAYEGDIEHSDRGRDMILESNKWKGRQIEMFDEEPKFTGYTNLLEPMSLVIFDEAIESDIDNTHQFDEGGEG